MNTKFNKASESTTSGRIPFDPEVWQSQDSGDFINTKTGEVRDEGGFLSEADKPGMAAPADERDAPQDIDSFDEPRSEREELADAGGDDDSAQVRPARRTTSDDDQAGYRPSKLSPKRR